MASLLNVNRAAVVGACQRTWSLGNVYSTDGRLGLYDAETLDAAVGIPGWSETMAAVGWLLIEADAVVIPDFEKFNGQGAKRRAQQRERMRNVRNLCASDAHKKRTRGEGENRTEQGQNRTASDLDGARVALSKEEGAEAFCTPSTGYDVDLSSVEPPDDKGAQVLELLGRITAVVPLRVSNDWPLLVKVAWLVADGELSENDLMESLEHIKKIRPKNPASRFHKCLENKALDVGENFNRMLASIRIIPAWLPRPVKRR